MKNIIKDLESLKVQLEVIAQLLATDTITKEVASEAIKTAMEIF